MTFDIYTNRVPFGLLNDDEQIQLMEHDGAIEAYYGGQDMFLQIDSPSWRRIVVYRAVRPALTKPSINWDHVADEFIAMVTDENKSTWLYEKIPNDIDLYWDDGRNAIPARTFSSFVPGTCDWRNSLVIRPGFEGR